MASDIKLVFYSSTILNLILFITAPPPLFPFYFLYLSIGNLYMNFLCRYMRLSVYLLVLYMQTHTHTHSHTHRAYV